MAVVMIVVTIVVIIVVMTMARHDAGRSDGLNVVGTVAGRRLDRIDPSLGPAWLLDAQEDLVLA